MEEYIERMKKSSRKMLAFSIIGAVFGIGFFVLYFILPHEGVDIFELISFFGLGLFCLLGAIVFISSSYYKDFRKEVEALGDYDEIIAELDAAPKSELEDYTSILTDEYLAFITKEKSHIWRRSEIVSAQLDEQKINLIIVSRGKDNPENKTAITNKSGELLNILCNIVTSAMITTSDEKELTT